MKNLTLLLVLAVTTVFSQDFEKSNYATFVMSPGSLEDGYSFGVQYEYQNNTIYTGLEFYSFPKLNDMTYTHFIGRFGFNKHFGKTHHTFRLYAGGRAGAITRAHEGTHTMMGIEVGFDIYIPNTPLYFRAYTSKDNKTDSKIWSQDPYHTVNSVILGIGVNF